MGAAVEIEFMDSRAQAMGDAVFAATIVSVPHLVGKAMHVEVEFCAMFEGHKRQREVLPVSSLRPTPPPTPHSFVENMQPEDLIDQCTPPRAHSSLCPWLRAGHPPQ